jgi:hypothetical protein
MHEMAKPQIPGFKTEHEKAEELGVGLRALRYWRSQRRGPPWAKIGKAVIYPDDGCAAWLRAQIQEPVRSRRAA